MAAQTETAQVDRDKRLPTPDPAPKQPDGKPIYRPGDDPGEFGRCFSRWTIDQSRKAGNPF